MNSFRPRSFSPPDAEALVGVYRDAVRTVGPQLYSPAQVEAWAKYPEDIEDFRRQLARGVTLVAEDAGNAAGAAGGEIVGFGQLESDGHLMFLYVSGRYCRQGAGTAIYSELENHARRLGISEIFTDASRFSRPFFAKHGFALTGTEVVVRFGAEFERFKMMKCLG